MFDTTCLTDISQREGNIEHIGLVIGTAGTPCYVHLQLEVARRFFGDSLPILVVNDGCEDKDVATIGEVLKQYHGVFASFGPKLGHAVGDIRCFKAGVDWAKQNNIQIILKLSRRSIPLISWRHELLALAARFRDVAAFGRFHDDNEGGLFRTDAIALRVRNIDNARWHEVINETIASLGGGKSVHVENMIWSLVKSMGGYARWELLGRDFYQTCQTMMQWRGILPCHYGDLSRVLGLPYTDEDFLQGSALCSVADKPQVEMPDKTPPKFVDVTQMRVLDDASPEAVAAAKDRDESRSNRSLAPEGSAA